MVYKNPKAIHELASRNAGRLRVVDDHSAYLPLPKEVAPSQPILELVNRCCSRNEGLAIIPPLEWDRIGADPLSVFYRYQPSELLPCKSPCCGSCWARPLPWLQHFGSADRLAGADGCGGRKGRDWIAWLRVHIGVNFHGCWKSNSTGSLPAPARWKRLAQGRKKQT